MNTRLVVLLATLSMLGPLAIDTYLPSFHALAREFAVGPAAIQQTLSVYLSGFAFMMLLSGGLSDAFGRRRVILSTLVLYVVASFGAAAASGFDVFLYWRLLQGLAAGAGSVVGRAVVRDHVAGPQAQRVLSYMLMVYALAPAAAPVLGGWIEVSLGWRAVFVFLGTCGLLMLALCHAGLAESLPPAARQRFAVAPMLANYVMVVKHARFMLMAVAGASMSIGFALYIGAAASFVVDILHLPTTAFAWLCLPMILGTMSGAAVVARMGARIRTESMVGCGYALMMLAAAADVGYSFLTTVALPWAVLPLMLYTFGRGLATPGITMLGLDLFPHHRGLAASLQSFIQMLVFALVAGILAPLLYDSAFKLACGLFGGCAISLVAWCAIQWGGRVAGMPARRRDATR